MIFSVLTIMSSITYVFGLRVTYIVFLSWAVFGQGFMTAECKRDLETLRREMNEEISAVRREQQELILEYHQEVKGKLDAWMESEQHRNVQTITLDSSHLVMREVGTAVRSQIIRELVKEVFSAIFN